MDKHKLILIQLKLQSSILIPRIWAGYIYGFWLGLSISIRYLQFAAGNTVGIFYSFLLLYNDIFQVTLLVIGFFIIIADAPFVNSMTYFTLIRSSGLLWRLSMTSFAYTASYIPGNYYHGLHISNFYKWKFYL